MVRRNNCAATQERHTHASDCRLPSDDGIVLVSLLTLRSNVLPMKPTDRVGYREETVTEAIPSTHTSTRTTP
jgi:hypothetical protein